jgi:hypothetical protein
MSFIPPAENGKIISITEPEDIENWTEHWDYTHDRTYQWWSRDKTPEDYEAERTQLVM